VLTAGFAVAALPASAEQRTITVTLLGGETVTIPVPAGTPLDQISLPQITTPIVAISDSAAKPAPKPAPTPQEPAAPNKADTKKGKKPRRPREREVVETVARVIPRKLKPAPRPRKTRFRDASGAPTTADPTYSLALPGAAPIGVPNFFIDKFRIPPFLLPIYQAAGIQYGVRWEVLAAINEIETDFGRNLNVSSAGALGWMQFMPATWKRYGTDANNDGRRDPYNPVDAIFAAARYLQAAGAASDLPKAVFAYNHADWYVDSVLMRAKVIGGLPADLVGSLTGLTQGQFPIRAVTRYAGDLRTRADTARRGINLYAEPGSPVIAVQDGKVVRKGHTRRLGRFVQLRDAYGNTYTYSHLSKRARTPSLESSPGPGRKERLFAHPERAPLPTLAHLRAGAAHRPIHRGRVAGGTVVGGVGRRGYLTFEIRPAGRGAPRIDPKPILDGWKLLESTAIYRAARKNPLLGKNPSIGQVLLMSKAQLQRRVLSNPRIEVYECGRNDIKAGIIDRRVLATLEFLAASGLRPTVTSLRCGHGHYTKGGNVSHHSYGSAVDIAKVNGVPVLGHQGAGSITEMAVQRLLTLQGTLKPAQIITLMTFRGADNTFAMGDHADHIHIGWRPLYGPNTKLGRQLNAVLKPGQWIKLVDRISKIHNPVVPTE
jgi:murein DD-endopeptidase MepM/ murein hydrolase activator NlpD